MIKKNTFFKSLFNFEYYINKKIEKYFFGNLNCNL